MSAELGMRVFTVVKATCGESEGTKDTVAVENAAMACGVSDDVLCV